jgi:sigma-E factor negative regulatory protein RseA
MTEEQRQRISELQDGELDHSDTSRLIDALAVDPQLRETWERYHAIGLAMRGEPVSAARRGIADAVRERVALEPTVLAPRRREPLRRTGMKPVAGIALAAAAAFTAVFLAPSLLAPGFFAPISSGPSSSSGLMAFESRSATLPTFAAGPSDGVLRTVHPAKRWDLDHPELVNKLDLFLVTHQETAPTTGAKGMLPYATFVGYEAGR